MERLYSLFYWASGKQQSSPTTNFQFSNYLNTTRYYTKTHSKDSSDYNSNYLFDIYKNDLEIPEEQLHSNAFTSSSTENDDSGYFQNDTTDVFALLKSAIIRKESIEIIRMLLDKRERQLILHTDTFGNNLLHTATRHEHLEAIKYLISLGADLNSKNSRGETPLHLTLICSSSQFLELMRTFVENEADLNCVDDCGNSFAHLCAARLNSKDYDASVTCLITLGFSHLFQRRNDLNQTPLHIAILRRMDINLETLKKISTASGCSFNERYSEGDTILHYAARWGGEVAVLQNIIKLGGDYRLRNNYLKTLLHCAVAGSNFEAIRYLIVLGADVNARDFLGRTPLHHLKFAKSQHVIGITKLLIENGADIGAVDDCGNTAAHHLSMSSPNEIYAKWLDLIRDSGNLKNKT